jgi:MFS family permease
MPEKKKRLRIDTAPLRHSKDFRTLFVGDLISFAGSMITYVALPFQIAHLTGSYVAVGLLGVVELVPLIVFGLWGGALADSIDRRRMVLYTEVGFALLSTVLLVNAVVPSPTVWVIYIVAMLSATLDGLQRPSRDAIIPRIVHPDHLAGASALNSIRWNFGSIVGPAIGGLIVAAAGVAAAYAVDVATFLVSIYAIWRISSVPPNEHAPAPSLRGISDGLKYAFRRKDLLGTYAVDLAAMIFAFPVSLFPFIAAQWHSAWSLGMLYAAPAVGALIATALSGWTQHVQRRGRAVLFAAIVWGIAIAAGGLAPNIWWLLAALAVAGAADMVSGLFRSLIWNLSIPDELRGRMAGVELLSYSVGPQLGQVRASFAAHRGGLRFSLVSGGLLAAGFAVVAAIALPALWRFNDSTDENVAAVLAERLERDDGAESPER